MITNVLLFLTYISTSCYGLYLIKSSPNWKTPGFIFGFFIYSIGAIMWMIILRLLPLSFAFPIASGSLMIGTLLTSYIFLQETISFLHLLGVALILIGIFIIASNQ